MKKQLFRLAAVLTVGAAALVASGAASNAAPSCSSTYACWWVNSNYTGTYYGSALNQSSWPAGIVNQDKSTFNNGTSGNAVHTYANNVWINPEYCLNMGSVLILPTSMRDNGQSHNWKASVSTCW